MTDKDLVLETMKKYGLILATTIQADADNMTATELVANENFIPTFQNAVSVKNMLDRPVGFVVKTSTGNVCRLIAVYNSEVYTDEPEQLPSLWGFKWTQEPSRAKEFVAISTSPYMIGDCCLWEGTVKRSIIDHNVHSPGDYPRGWEDAL